jgi:hypothetical protein
VREKKAGQQNGDKEEKRRETRFDGVAGSVERQREKKAIEGLVRPTGSKIAGTRRPSASASNGDKASPASSTTSGTSSSTLASILALADSPPVTGAPLVSTAASKEKEKKPLSTSSAVNSSLPSCTASGTQDGKDKVRAKKAALLERARAATAASRA